MNSVSFNQPQRQSILGSFFFFILTLQRTVRMLWPLILVYVLKSNEASAYSEYIYMGGAAIILLMIIHSFLSWKNYYFYIENNEFVVKKGYLKRVVTTIPFEKIVSINIKQGVFHQLLKVVELEVDSAGSKQAELRISALSRSLADALQQHLSAFKDEQRANSSEEAEVATKHIRKTIFKLDLGDLIKIGITQNHLKGLALMFVFGNNIYQGIKDIFDKELGVAADKTSDFISHSSLYVVGVLIVAVIIVAFVISMGETFLRFFKLRLEQSDAAFSIKSGLLKRRAITIPFSRVQAIYRNENPLQRWVGYSAVRLVQANSTEQKKASEQVVIPGCSIEQYELTCNYVYNQPLEQEFATLRPHGSFGRRVFFITLLISSIPAAIAAYNDIWWPIPLPIVFSLIYAYLCFKKRKFMISDDYLQIWSGAFGNQQTLIELYKMQTIRIKQTIFQRMNSVATINIVMGGASVRINHIQYSDAVVIKDYLLDKVNSTSRSWL